MIIRFDHNNNSGEWQMLFKRKIKINYSCSINKGSYIIEVIKL